MRTPDDFSPEDRLAAGHLQGMVRGKAASLEALYALYHRPLLALIGAIIYDTGGSEELLQDVFVRAYREARQYDAARGTPFVWLATIARRMAYDWLRKKRRRPQFVDIKKEHPGQDADTFLAEDEKEAAQQLEARLVLEHLQHLSDDQGKALELAFLHGHTHTEISELMGKPVGTVKSDLRRGLMRLRQLYLGEDD